MKRFIVIGLGNFGSSVAETLYQKGHDVIALDLNEDAVDRTAPHVTRAAVGDGRQREILERLGVKDSNVAIVSTGDDITSSILATMALRDLGVAEIYVKVISRDHARVMTRLGVTETIFPEREAALNLGTRLSAKTVFNYVSLTQDFGMQEMTVPDIWEGKTLLELALPTRYKVSIVAIYDVLRNFMQVPPDPTAVLKDSDTLFVVGSEKNLARLAQLK